MKGAAIAVLAVATLTLAGCMDMIYRKPLGEDEAAEMVLDEIPAITKTINTLERRPGMVSISSSVTDTTQDPPMHLAQEVTWGDDGAVKAVISFRASMQNLQGLALDEVGNETGNQTGNETAGADNQTGDDPYNGSDDGFTVSSDLTGQEDVSYEEFEAEMEKLMQQTIDLRITLYCTSEKLVMVYDGTAYEGRPAEDCSSIEPDDGTMTMPDIDLSEVTVESIDVHLWETEAVVRDSDGALIDVQLDKQGRLTYMATHDGEDVTLLVEAEYGSRKPLNVPETTAEDRMAADVDWAEEDVGTVFDPITRYTITSIDEQAALSEFEVHVLEDFGPDKTTVAKFPMDASGSEGRYTFDVLDADEDGLLSQGDIFTVSQAPPEEGQFGEIFDVTIWDTWADAEVGSFEVPGPGIFALLAILGLALVLYRRR